jgi:transcriptional regulator with XRE-family HTH domain
MINAEQIRAARALLDWSTADLAKLSDMTVNGLNKIERGHVQAQTETIEKLENVFEAAGIEFLPNSGLRKKDRIIQTFDGDDAHQQLLEDVFKTLKGTGGEVLIAFVDETKSINRISRAVLESHITRLVDANITERLLVREGEQNLIAPIDFYHTIPDEYFSSYPFYIYGTKLALVSRQPESKVVIINDERFAESVKRLFNFVWGKTTQPQIKKA